MPALGPRIRAPPLSWWALNIIPDPILVLVQAFPFFVLIYGLNAILFKPMLAYLKERESATAGAKEEAEELQEKAALKLTQWEAALARALAEVAEFRTTKRLEAQAAYAKRVAAARAEAEVHIADAVDVIAGEAALAREQIAPMARSLSAEMASRALGRSISSVEA